MTARGNSKGGNKTSSVRSASRRYSTSRTGGARLFSVRRTHLGAPIANRVGSGSPNAFAARFRRHVGLAPANGGNGTRRRHRFQCRGQRRLRVSARSHLSQRSYLPPRSSCSVKREGVMSSTEASTRRGVSVSAIAKNSRRTQRRYGSVSSTGSHRSRNLRR